jgi:DNA-directed RNA polymerase subunit E'/Rpb7
MSEVTPVSRPRPKLKDNRKRGVGIFMRNVITKKVHLPFSVLGSNIKENIQLSLVRRLEGYCIQEGYIKPNSIRIISYSAGTFMGADVTFEVMFECLVCRPVEGMRFRAIVKNITKAGVRAETNTEPSPVVVFIARDHHYKSKGFSSLKEGDEINVRVIGIRYELNDRYISIIGEHVPTKTGARRIPRKPKISISAKSFGKKST